MPTGIDPRAKPALNGVRVQVAQQQCRLEEDHGRAPDHEAAAEHRQQRLRRHGLDLEQKERRRERGRAIDPDLCHTLVLPPVGHMRKPSRVGGFCPAGTEAGLARGAR